MPLPRRSLPAIVLAALVASGCASGPAPTAGPSGAGLATPPALPTSPPERPFAKTASPAGGSWCSLPGAVEGHVRIGRIEAVDERTVRFTLCAPDAAFDTRLADPVAGIVDAATVDAIAADPSFGRFAAGAGRYRLAAWSATDNLRLERVAAKAGAKGDDAVATIILRWSPSAAARTDALREGSVDIADTPGPSQLDEIDTLPELVAVDRAGMSTAYVAFGYGQDFAQAAVRRAFAQAFDRDALGAAAFPRGSSVATHVAPCEVELGCSGKDWYAANGPAAVAALDAAGFDRKASYQLYVPSEPVPGLPDPAALGQALASQAADRLGITLQVQPIPPADLAGLLATRKLRGLYLGGVASRLADATGFLGPLVGPGATGPTADRAGDAMGLLVAAASETDAGARAKDIGAANDAVRAQVPLIPIAHAGSTLAFRDDVQGAATSPLSMEALGRFVPGDRHQLVLIQASQPSTAWCALASTADDRRLCGLVTPGLMVFKPDTLVTAPGLAQKCTPDGTATTWTCRLRADATFTSGAHLDAGDVVASLAAQADPSSALRAALPADAFAAWDELFGFPAAGVPAAPSPEPSAGPAASPSAGASPDTGSPGAGSPPAGASPDSGPAGASTPVPTGSTTPAGAPSPGPSAGGGSSPAGTDAAPGTGGPPSAKP